MKKQLDRTALIEKGKVWQIYADNDADIIIFEGNKTACKKYIRDYRLSRQIKKGVIRLGRLIFEP